MYYVSPGNAIILWYIIWFSLVLLRFSLPGLALWPVLIWKIAVANAFLCIDVCSLTVKYVSILTLSLVRLIHNGLLCSRLM